MIHLAAAEVNISVRDGSGSLAYITLYVPGDIEIATARAAVEMLRGLLSSVITGSIERYAITYTTFIANGRGNTGAKKQDIALFVFETTSDNYAVVALPTIDPAFVLEDNSIDIEVAEIVALISAIESGIYCNPFGDDITDINTALLGFEP